MSVSEISGLESALETDPNSVDLGVSNTASGGLSVTVATEPENDRVAINALSDEPVKTFVIDPQSGSVRTVEVDAASGRKIPLTTGVSQSAMAEQVISSGRVLAIATQAIVRDKPNSDRKDAQVQVIDPKTGEIIKTLAKSDVFDLDRTLREYARKSLVDRSA